MEEEFETQPTNTRRAEGQGKTQFCDCPSGRCLGWATRSPREFQTERATKTKRCLTVKVKLTGKNEDVGGEGASRRTRARQASSESAITAIRVWTTDDVSKETKIWSALQRKNGQNVFTNWAGGRKRWAQNVECDWLEEWKYFKGRAARVGMVFKWKVVKSISETLRGGQTSTGKLLLSNREKRSQSTDCPQGWGRKFRSLQP